MEVQTVVPAAHDKTIAIPLPEPTPADNPAGNYTKLEILPTYLHFQLTPGAGDERTVTVRNRDTTTITVSPAVRQNIYSGPYLLETSWISITPATADIPAGQSAKFTIHAALPQDVPRGSYTTQIAFTDEEYPAPYPQASPSYVHAMTLSVDAAALPVIRINPSYISDQLEAGNVYRYAVNLTNNGATPLALSPKIESDNYLRYWSSDPGNPGLNTSAFSIDAPSSIPPHGNATMTVTVRVPPAMSDSYNGYIDLGIDDPGLREGEGRISMNFMIWQQPPGDFTRQFSMRSPDTITLVLTATPQYSPSPEVVQLNPVREPSFDVSLTGPSGSVAVQQVKKEIHGTVSVGMDPRIYGTGTGGMYQTAGTQYAYTYTAPGRPGTWTLAVTPRNTQNFEYTISFGDVRESSPFFLQPLYNTGSQGTNLK